MFGILSNEYIYEKIYLYLSSIFGIEKKSLVNQVQYFSDSKSYNSVNEYHELVLNKYSFPDVSSTKLIRMFLAS